MKEKPGVLNSFVGWERRDEDETIGVATISEVLEAENVSNVNCQY